MRELSVRGLIERRDNSNDLRSPIFSLTPSGQALFAQVRGPISAFIRQLVEQVPPEDLAAANRVLWAVTRGTLEPAKD